MENVKIIDITDAVEKDYVVLKIGDRIYGIIIYQEDKDAKFIDITLQKLKECS